MNYEYVIFEDIFKWFEDIFKDFKKYLQMN